MSRIDCTAPFASLKRSETRRPTHARKSHSVYLDGQGSARVLGLDEAAEAVAGGVER